MYKSASTRPRSVHAYHLPMKCPSLRGRFQLTRADRIGIERLLSLGLASETENPRLMEGFLRHKLRIAGSVLNPVPADLVTAGRYVSYITNNGKTRSGLLTFVPGKQTLCIPVTSFLGATMLGMQKMQKAPVLRTDGWIDTLVVLNVSGP